MFESKVPACVVVTAGASGIGWSIVRAFVRAGARVHLGDIDAAAVQAAVQGDAPISGSCVDVSQSAQVDRFIDEAHRALGRIDVLVNNAGIGGPRAAVEEISDEQWHAVLGVNVTGAFYCVRRTVPLMRQQGGGSIINIGTTSTRTGLPMRTPYVVSKEALMGLTRNLARELGPANIRCNAVLPGSIENERGRALLRKSAEQRGISYEDALQQRLGYISMRTRIDPDEVGAAVVFLASEAARHISGQMLGVCGNVEWEG